MSLILIVCMWQLVLCYGWSPKSKEELQAAVRECLDASTLSWRSCDRGPHGPIGSWNISEVTDMGGLFDKSYISEADKFMGDLSKWDVSRVTNMKDMFHSGASFNGDLSKWDVSKVTNTKGMFHSARLFNGDISKWVVSSVLSMANMFESASSFNGDISKWDVSSVIIFSSMFLSASAFNGDISKWEISASTTGNMFNGASSFKGDLSKWDVSRVINMHGMFASATSFNGDISKWDVSNVMKMDQMFSGASSFAQTLCGTWSTSKASNDGIFDDSSGKICPPQWPPQSKAELQFAIRECLQSTPDVYTNINPLWVHNGVATNDCSEGLHGMIRYWDVSHVTDMSQMFNQYVIPGSNKFVGDISNWDVSRVTDMNHMFGSATMFNADLSKWDVSSVTTMRRMFDSASSFDGVTNELRMFLHTRHVGLSAWDVSSVASMHGMFASASSFEGDISKWDVSRVTDMEVMFTSAIKFNGDISKWDTSRVISMRGMFSQASKFNADLSNWDVSTVAIMASMFSSALSFNSDLSKWAVYRVTNMADMFSGASSFHGDLSRWDVCRVTNMGYMFNHASSFKSDISKWDVSSVTNMRGMFTSASSFDCDISKWNVLNVASMDYMFLNAASFEYALCGDEWVNSKASKTDMLTGSRGLLPRAVSCRPAPTTPTVTTATLTYVSSHTSPPSPATTPTVTTPTLTYVPHRPIIERELIVRTTTSTDRTTTCPRCGAFRKSGRVSCCAPGGAWFKNCGGRGSKHVDHRWSDGVKACKSGTITAGVECATCGTIAKSGQISCCGRGGSWFGNCGRVGNAKLSHTWFEGIQACKTLSQFKRASGRQSNAAQRLHSSNGVHTGNSKAVMTTANAFGFTSVNTFTHNLTATPEASPSGYDRTNFKTIKMSPATLISTPNNTSMTILFTGTKAVTTTTKTISATNVTSTRSTQYVQKATVEIDWISQVSFIVIITVACTTLLFMVASMTTGYYLVRKNVSLKKGEPVISS